MKSQKTTPEDRQRQKDNEAYWANVTRKFVDEALVYKIGVLCPDLKPNQVVEVAAIVHEDMKKSKTPKDLPAKLVSYNLGPDRAKTLNSINIAEHDIGAAIVGLGIDMEEVDPASAIHWTEGREQPRRVRRATKKVVN